jgi:short-subunit dehydrogenase
MNRLPRFMWLTAERVSREGYISVMKNQAICVPGMQYKAITALARLLPLRQAHRLGELRSRVLANRK